MLAIHTSIRRPNNFGCAIVKEVLTRFMAHICFCKGEIISNEPIDKTIKLVNTLAFTYIPTDRSGVELTKEQLAARNQAQQDQMKIQKAAINCLTNIYNRQNASTDQNLIQPALKDNSVESFKHLKELFQYLVKKLQ